MIQCISLDRLFGPIVRFSVIGNMEQHEVKPLTVRRALQHLMTSSWHSSKSKGQLAMSQNWCLAPCPMLLLGCQLMQFITAAAVLIPDDFRKSKIASKAS